MNVASLDLNVPKLLSENIGVWHKDALEDFLTTMFIVFTPSLMQRLLISRNLKQAQISVMVTSFISLLFCAVMGLTVVVIKHYLPNHIEGNVVLHMITYLLSPEMKGLMLIVILSAIFSSADSDLNIAALTLCETARTPKNIMLVSVIMGVVSYCISLFFDYVLDIIIFFTSIWMITMCGPIILGILFRLKNYSAAFLLWPAILGCIVFSLCIYLKSIAVITTSPFLIALIIPSKI